MRQGRHPHHVLSAAFVRTAPLGAARRRQRPVPLRPAHRNSKLGPAARRSRTTPRTRTRRRRAHEGQARAPGPVVPALGAGSRRRAGARQRRGADLSQPPREADIGDDTAQDAPAPPDRGRGARLPVVVTGLGGRGDGPPARGHRGGAGARGPEQDRGRLRAVGRKRPRTRPGAPWSAGGRYVRRYPAGVNAPLGSPCPGSGPRSDARGDETPRPPGADPRRRSPATTFR